MRPKQTIRVIDETQVVEIPQTQPRPIDENILILGSFGMGTTNKPVQFYAGEGARFIEEFGAPNFRKNGVGHYIALEALNNNRNMGVLAVNLKPATATYANAAIVAKLKVTPDVAKTNESGDPLYLTPGNVETTESDGNTAIVRDVMTATYSVVSFANITRESQLQEAMTALRSDVADAEGFKTYPLVGFYYKGKGDFGNNINFRMLEYVSRYTGEYLYALDLFDGTKVVNLEDNSFFSDSAVLTESVFIESIVNSANTSLRAVSANDIEDFYEALVPYLGPKLKKVDLFTAEEYQYEVASTSTDFTSVRAVRLDNGAEGLTADYANLVGDFFDGKIVDDIDSLIRYRIDVVPDLNFTNGEKAKLISFLNRRTYSTTAILMAGADTLESAIVERETLFKGEYPSVLLIPNAQSPKFQDPYTKRAFTFPLIYFFMKSYCENYRTHANSFMPLAGPNARVTGFIEDTMLFPSTNEKLLDNLDKSRINVLRKDTMPGAYIYTQNTNTEMDSDSTELNNICILRSIIYDIVNMAHSKNYTFNDFEEVEKFDEDMTLTVRPKYSNYVSGIITKVGKKSLTGSGKNTNIINVTVNFKDLLKSIEANITLTDRLL
jgi:hypothetical protein